MTGGSSRRIPGSEGARGRGRERESFARSRADEAEARRARRRALALASVSLASALALLAKVQDDDAAVVLVSNEPLAAGALHDFHITEGDGVPEGWIRYYLLAPKVSQAASGGGAAPLRSPSGTRR